MTFLSGSNLTMRVGRLSVSPFVSVGCPACRQPKHTVIKASPGMAAGVSMTNVNSPPRGCHRFVAVRLTVPPDAFVFKSGLVQDGGSAAAGAEAAPITIIVRHALTSDGDARRMVDDPPTVTVSRVAGRYEGQRRAVNANVSLLRAI